MPRYWNRVQWVKLDSRYDGGCNENANKCKSRILQINFRLKAFYIRPLLYIPSI